MKNNPSSEDLQTITHALSFGDRIKALSVYISITGCGLTEAHEFIHELTNQMRSMELEHHTSKQDWK